MAKAKKKLKTTPRPPSRSSKSNRARQRRDLNTHRSKPAVATAPDVSVSTKRGRVLAMLRSPSGASLASLAEATHWQPHSVRGFLAAVVRKQLGLTLVSTLTDQGRIYRIVDQTDAV